MAFLRSWSTTKDTLDRPNRFTLESKSKVVVTPRATVVLGSAAGAPPVRHRHIRRWRCRAAQRAGLQLHDRPLRQ